MELLFNILIPDSKTLSAAALAVVWETLKSWLQLAGTWMHDAKALAIVLNPVLADALKLASDALTFPEAISSLYRFTILLAAVALFGAFTVMVPFVSCNKPKFMARSSVAAVVISLMRWPEIGAAVVPAIERN